MQVARFQKQCFKGVVLTHTGKGVGAHKALCEAGDGPAEGTESAAPNLFCFLYKLATSDMGIKHSSFCLGTSQHLRIIQQLVSYSETHTDLHQHPLWLQLLRKEDL